MVAIADTSRRGASRDSELGPARRFATGVGTGGLGLGGGGSGASGSVSSWISAGGVRSRFGGCATEGCAGGLRAGAVFPVDRTGRGTTFGGLRRGTSGARAGALPFGRRDSPHTAQVWRPVRATDPQFGHTGTTSPSEGAPTDSPQDGHTSAATWIVAPQRGHGRDSVSGVPAPSTARSAPHLGHRVSVPPTNAPHEGHRYRADVGAVRGSSPPDTVICAPQFAQRRLPGGTGAPHSGQEGLFALTIGRGFHEGAALKSLLPRCGEA